MILKALQKFLSVACFATVVLQSCKDDSNLTTPLPIANQSFSEEFDTLAAASAKGWVIRNRSEPIGRGTWQQGMTGNQFLASVTHTAFSSKATNNGYISADFTSCHITGGPGEGTISNWIISPKTLMQNGDKIIFYARGADTLSRWADRLQVWLNTNNDGIECGRGETVGDFDVKILDINPKNAAGTPTNPFPAGTPIPFVFDPVTTFPYFWTRFEAKVIGLSKPINGRFGFRYFVPYGGDNGNGDHISLDAVTYISVSK
jgi:hypothetical protein